MPPQFRRMLTCTYEHRHRKGGVDYGNGVGAFSRSLSLDHLSGVLINGSQPVLWGEQLNL